jgi:steroid 5-alpha reductase family enzyme
VWAHFEIRSLTGHSGTWHWVLLCSSVSPSQPSLLTFNDRNPDVWYMEKLSLWENTCRFGGQHPLLMANVLLFINLDVFFWLANLAQDSTWLIDPYWTIIPVLLGHWYWHHPLAHGNPLRAWLVMALLYVWSARLTHSYFRREEGWFGAREDWRFLELRSQYPRTWWWSSFFLAYVSQHIFLFGVSLPLYAAFHDPSPAFGVVDILCIGLSLFGIYMASSADTTLRKFMEANDQRELRGEPKKLLLEDGFWYYSRHPNYVGEQLHWWGLGLLAWHQGYTWMLLGPLLNSICLAVATDMVEKRMLRNEARRDVYKQYQNTTSIWIPLPKFGGAPRQERHQE